jgi:hypothetical protein
MYPDVQTQMKQIARKRRLHHEKAIAEAKVLALSDSKSTLNKTLQLNILKESGNHMLN